MTTNTGAPVFSASTPPSFRRASPSNVNNQTPVVEASDQPDNEVAATQPSSEPEAQGLPEASTDDHTSSTTEDEPQQQPKASSLPDWVIAGRPDKNGPRLLLWKLYTVLHLWRISWIPQPRPYGSYTARIPEICNEIVSQRHLSQAIIAVLTSKGGATKTTVSTWLSAILMWITKFVVLVFDADRGGGKAAKRLGLDPSKTLAIDRVSHMIVNMSWKPTYEDLIPVTSADHDTGVMVFHCPPGVELNEANTKTTLTAVKSTCHTLVIDSGPGLAVPATNGAVAASTVQIIPADFNSGDDLADVQATLDYGPYQRNGLSTDSVVIAISAVPWRKFNTRTQFELARQYGVDPSQVVLIPFVKHLLKTRQVGVGSLNAKTLWAWCRLAEAVTKLAIAHNTLNPPKALPDELQATSAEQSVADDVKTSLTEGN